MIIRRKKRIKINKMIAKLMVIAKDNKWKKKLRCKIIIYLMIKLDTTLINLIFLIYQ